MCYLYKKIFTTFSLYYSLFISFIIITFISPEVSYADPTFCTGALTGSVGQSCEQPPPIRMMSQDVSIMQDINNGWYWNIKASYCFRNLSSSKLTIPLVFPGNVDGTCCACFPKTSEFKVRVNGKIIVGNKNQSNEKANGEHDSFAKYVKAIVDCSPECRNTLRKNSIDTSSESLFRNVRKECSEFIFESTNFCSSDVQCFPATFPAKSDTIMHINYKYIGTPDYFVKLSEFGQLADFEPSSTKLRSIASNKELPTLYDARPLYKENVALKFIDAPGKQWTQQQEVQFILRTGADWENSIGRVKFRIGIYDLPLNLRFCYGSRCTGFHSESKAILNGMKTKAYDDGKRTIITFEGENIEPDGNVKFQYDRQSVELAELLDYWCGYKTIKAFTEQGMYSTRWELEKIAKEKLKDCRILPHHYLGYRFKSEKIQNRLEKKLSNLQIQLVKFEYSDVDDELIPTSERTTQLGSPSKRYRLPSSIKYSNKARLKRGFRQWPGIKSFVDAVNKHLKKR